MVGSTTGAVQGRPIAALGGALWTLESLRHLGTLGMHIVSVIADPRGQQVHFSKSITSHCNEPRRLRMYLARRSIGRNVVVRRSVRRSLAPDTTLEPGRFRSLIPSAGILAPFAQFVRISTGALRATIRIPALWTPAFERLMVVA